MLTGAFDGEWWLPASSEHRVAGTMALAWNERPRLTVHGLLNAGDVMGAASFALMRQDAYPVVFGSLSDGTRVTLEATSSGGGNEIHLDDPDASVIQLEAQRGWIGLNVENPEGELFSEVVVALSGLAGFAGALPKRASLGEVTAGVEPFPNAEGGTDAAFRMVSAGPLPLRVWADRYVGSLRDLVAFATGLGTTVLFLGASQDGPGGKRELEIIERRREPAANTLTSRDALLDFDSAPGGFEGTIVRWLALAGELRAILSLFLGRVYAPFMYEEHRFLNLAYATESYHRIRVDGTRLPAAEYDRRVDLVARSAPDELGAWLREEMKHGNFLSYRSRLRSLLNGRPWLEREVTGAYGGFVDRVVATRNYHTHWDETTRGSSASGFDLFPLCTQLSILLEACILGELGFSSDRCREAIVERSRHFSTIRFNPALFPGTEAFDAANRREEPGSGTQVIRR